MKNTALYLTLLLLGSLNLAIATPTASYDTLCIGFTKRYNTIQTPPSGSTVLWYTDALNNGIISNTGANFVDWSSDLDGDYVLHYKVNNALQHTYNIHVETPRKAQLNFIKEPCTKTTKINTGEGFTLRETTKSCIGICDSTFETFEIEKYNTDIVTISTSGVDDYVINGNYLTVHWNLALGEPKITLINTTPGGCVDSSEYFFCLMEKPIAKFITSPEFKNNTIFICKGATVTFEDLSIMPPLEEEDFQYWHWNFGDGKSETYYRSNLEDPASNYVSTVTHQYNSLGVFTMVLTVGTKCGCPDTMSITVVVEEGLNPLKINCKDLACAYQVSSYSSNNTSCGNYKWTIQGGKLIAPFNGPSVNVIWGDPSSGFGQLCLEVSNCTDSICAKRTCLSVPILSPNVSIIGPDTVTIDQNYGFILPSWDLTNYSWQLLSLNPGTGDVIVGNNAANSISVYTGNNGPIPRSFIISCEYDNPADACPPYNVNKTVYVLPSYYIEPKEDVFCIGQRSFNLKSDLTAMIGNYTYELFKSGLTLPIASGVLNAPSYSFSYNFTDAGKYSIKVKQVGPRLMYEKEVIKNFTIEKSNIGSPLFGKDLICQGESSIYQVLPKAGYSMEWVLVPSGSSNSTFMPNNTGTPILSSTDQNAQIYWDFPVGATETIKVRYIPDDPNKCPSAWIQKTISRKTIANLDFTTSNSLHCANGVSMFTATPANAEKYEWEVLLPSAVVATNPTYQWGNLKSGNLTRFLDIQWNSFPSGYTSATNSIPVKLTATICLTEQFNITKNFTVSNAAEVGIVCTTAAPICAMDDVYFKITPNINGATYAVDFKDGSSIQNVNATGSGDLLISHKFENTTGVDIYPKPTVELVTAGNNCISGKAAICSLTVKPRPIAIISTTATTAICSTSALYSSQTVILKPTISSSTATYAWYKGNTLVTGNPPISTSPPQYDLSYTASPPPFDDYHVIVTEGGCSAKSNVITLSSFCNPTNTSGPGPCVLNQTVSQTVTWDCGSAPGTMKINVANSGVTGTSIVYYSKLELGSAEIEGSNAEFIIDKPGTYKVLSWAANSITGCKTPIAETLIDVPFVGNFSINDVCSGTNINLEAKDQTLFVSGTTYSVNWSITSGAPSISPNNSALNVGWNGINVGTYTITHAVTSGTKTCSTAKTKYIYPVPNATFTISNTTGCEAVPLILTHTYPIENIASEKYEAILFGGSLVLAKIQKISSVNIFSLNSSTYKIEHTIVDKRGCEDKKSINQITINPNPYKDGFFISWNSPVCKSDLPIELTAKNLNGAGNPIKSSGFFTWSNSSTTNPLSINAPGTYSVSVTNSYGCFSAAGPASLQLKGLPNIDIILKDNICYNTPIEAKANIANTNLTYAWSVETFNGTTSLRTYNYPASAAKILLYLKGVHAFSPALVTIPTSAKLRLTVTDPSSGCIDMVERTYSVRGIGDGVINASSLCLNSNAPVSLTAVLPVGTFTPSILWGTGQTVSTIYPILPGKYEVRFTDNLGCYSDTNITIFPGPVLFDDYCVKLCPGTILDIKPYNGYVNSWSWFTNNVLTSSNTYTPAALIPAQSITPVNNYSLTIQDKNGCDASSGKLYVSNSTNCCYGPNNATFSLSLASNTCAPIKKFTMNITLNVPNYAAGSKLILIPKNELVKTNPGTISVALSGINTTALRSFTLISPAPVNQTICWAAYIQNGNELCPIGENCLQFICDDTNTVDEYCDCGLSQIKATKLLGSTGYPCKYSLDFLNECDDFVYHGIYFKTNDGSINILPQVNFLQVYDVKKSSVFVTRNNIFHQLPKTQLDNFATLEFLYPKKQEQVLDYSWIIRKWNNTYVEVCKDTIHLHCTYCSRVLEYKFENGYLVLKIENNTDQDIVQADISTTLPGTNIIVDPINRLSKPIKSGASDWVYFKLKNYALGNAIQYKLSLRNKENNWAGSTAGFTELDDCCEIIDLIPAN